MLYYVSTRKRDGSYKSYDAKISSSCKEAEDLLSVIYDTASNSFSERPTLEVMQEMYNHIMICANKTVFTEADGYLLTSADDYLIDSKTITQAENILKLLTRSGIITFESKVTTKGIQLENLMTYHSTGATIENIVIPEGVTSIKLNRYADLKNIRLILPVSCTKIRRDGFGFTKKRAAMSQLDSLAQTRYEVLGDSVSGFDATAEVIANGLMKEEAVFYVTNFVRGVNMLHLRMQNENTYLPTFERYEANPLRPISNTYCDKVMCYPDGLRTRTVFGVATPLPSTPEDIAIATAKLPSFIGCADWKYVPYLQRYSEVCNKMIIVLWFAGKERSGVITPDGRIHLIGG